MIPQNINSSYILSGKLFKNNVLAAYIDDTINKVDLTTKYKIKPCKDNFYVIPFCIDPKKCDGLVNGFIDGSNLSIKIKIKQKFAFENKYLNIHIFAPMYTIYSSNRYVFSNESIIS